MLKTGSFRQQKSWRPKTDFKSLLGSIQTCLFKKEVYYVGGMALHAVEVATGKHLWRLKSPDVAVNRGAFFFGFCAAVLGKNGKKGRIIANTGLNVYCYEAAR